MNPADIAFIIICTGLVMLMTPGLALFYGGLVRSRNVLSTTMHSFITMGIVPVLWFVVGYSLAFGPDLGGIIGGFSHVLLRGVDMEGAGAASGIPPLLFMLFQCMFAVLTLALISGSYAERIHFPAMLLFSILWLLFVYCPMAHWVWGGGWMAKMGAVDFAGGAVVHMASAAGGLAAARTLGPRLGLGRKSFAPHNPAFDPAGRRHTLVWLVRLQRGSALAANHLAVHAMVTTQMAAAAGVLGWLLVEWKHVGKPTSLGAASGALAGLVAITPAAGFVDIWASLVIGLVGGIVCYVGVLCKNRLGYDDALDVVGIHGVGGTWGALATGIFAVSSVNGVDGLLYGNPGQLWVQFVSVVGTWGFVYVASLIILRVVDTLVGLRVAPDPEIAGLDMNEHNERAYQI